MSVDQKKFQPGTVSTDILRGNTKSYKIASNVSSAIKSHNDNLVNSAKLRSEENPFLTNDNFSSNTENITKNPDKKILESLIREKNIREMTAKEHVASNNKAQSLILYLLKQAFPEGLSFFERSKYISSNPEQADEIAREDFERLQENPSQILEVALTVVPRKLAEMKNLAKNNGAVQKMEHLERIDSILGQIFHVMEQVSGQGSHTALLSLIESLDQTKIGNELHQLISEYHRSLEKLGKQIQRANAQLLNRTRHPHSELITGIISKPDQGLRAILYTRPESLGAALRDHLGGILGSIYDFLDTEWMFSANTWEYSQKVKGQNMITKAPYPVRRLAQEMRGYIGTLTEEQPGPMFVTTDVEAKSLQRSPKSRRKNSFDQENDFDEDDEDFDEDKD